MILFGYETSVRQPMRACWVLSNWVKRTLGSVASLTTSELTLCHMIVEAVLAAESQPF